MYKYSYEEDKRSEKIILPRVYVLDDGLGDIVALCRMARKLKENIEKFNSENSSLGAVYISHRQPHYSTC